MYYFLLAILVALLIGAIVSCGKNNMMNTKKGTLTTEKIVIIVMTIIFTCILGFESELSNGDMQLYQNTYQLYQIQSPPRLDGKKDYVFQVLCYAFSKTGLNFYIWHALIGIFFVFVVCSFVKKYSSNIYISFIVFIALGQFAFSLSALRQMLAIAFILLSFIFIEQKKAVKFIVLVLIASLFHSTAIVFIIAYPLYMVRLKVKTIIVMVLGMLVASRYIRPILDFLLPRIGAQELYYDYLESDTTLSLSGLVIAFGILVFSVICLKDDKESKCQGLCNFAVVSCFFRLLSTFAFAEMFRLSLYFSVFDMILIAEACTCYRKSKTPVMIKTFAVTLCLVLYFAVSPTPNVLNYESLLFN